MNERFNLLGGHWTTNSQGQLVIDSNLNRHWRLEALYDGYMHRKIEYEGDDYEEMQRQLARLCITLTVDKIFVHRDQNQYRYIELR